MSLRYEPAWVEANGSRVEVWSDCLRVEVGDVNVWGGVPYVVVEVEPDPDPAPDSGRIFVRMMVQN